MNGTEDLLKMNHWYEYRTEQRYREDEKHKERYDDIEINKAKSDKTR